jgi:hypothetical protein
MTVELRAPDGTETSDRRTVESEGSPYRVSNPLNADRPGTWQIRVRNASGALVWRGTFEVS